MAICDWFLEHFIDFQHSNRFIWHLTSYIISKSMSVLEVPIWNCSGDHIAQCTHVNNPILNNTCKKRYDTNRTERENRVPLKIGAMHLRPLPFYRTNIQFNKQPYDSGELHSAPVYECNWICFCFFLLLANTITMISLLLFIHHIMWMWGGKCIGTSPIPTIYYYLW